MPQRPVSVRISPLGHPPVDTRNLMGRPVLAYNVADRRHNIKGIAGGSVVLLRTDDVLDSVLDDVCSTALTLAVRPKLGFCSPLGAGRAS